jgi:hypothetical protein
MASLSPSLAEGTQITRVRRFQTRSAGHNDVVWRTTRFIFWCLFYGFVGSELAFFTPPLRGLSQKVAALVLCAFKCSAPAVPMRTCVLASPRRSDTAERVPTTAGATQERLGKSFYFNEAARLKRGGAYAVNALLIALITAVWIICVFGCLLPLPLDLTSLGSSFLLLSLRLAAVGPI